MQVYEFYLIVMFPLMTVFVIWAAIYYHKMMNDYGTQSERNWYDARAEVSVKHIFDAFSPEWTWSYKLGTFVKKNPVDYIWNQEKKQYELVEKIIGEVI